MKKQPLKAEVTISRLGDLRCERLEFRGSTLHVVRNGLKDDRRVHGSKYRVYFTVGIQQFAICDSDKRGCTEMKEALEQAVARVLDGYRWKVVVDRRKTGTAVFYRARFIVKNIPFLLALTEKDKDDPDGPQGARLHCLFVARMFKKALKNMGIKP